MFGCVLRKGKGSFQRTYEELKLDLSPEEVERFDRFQRTYEELKPEFIAEGNCVFPGFQRTYEELKLLLPGFCILLDKVFSVPMRN